MICWAEPRSCPACLEPYVGHIGFHMERCVGLEPVGVVARKIVAGEPFTDVDAVRVARELLEATG